MPALSRFPFLSADDVADRVADRSFNLLTPEQVAVDRLLMSLHPESTRVERETLDYLERLNRESKHTWRAHHARCIAMLGLPPSLGT